MELVNYMRKYMSEYIKYVDDYINKKDYKDIEEFMKEHLIKIGFFQHERLIHLLVTLFYAFVCILFLFLPIVWVYFIIITLILMTFLIFYIRHYFFLENGVQYMYKQYDKLKELCE